MKSKKLIKVFNILLVVISMVTIFLFSSENIKTSNDTTRKVVKDVISTVVKEDNASIKKAEISINDNIVLIRKCAHLIEYFILGFLLINVVKDYKKVSLKWIILAIMVCLIYAGSDEFHQLFVEGRSGRVLDVGIDTLGAFLGIMVYYLLYKKYHKDVRLVS